jgi:hypothetical protein
MASVPQRKVQAATTEHAKAQAVAPTAVAVPPMESPSPSASETLSAQDIYRMIQETAYFKAEARNFAPGVELQDWIEAENEVRQRLQAS